MHVDPHTEKKWGVRTPEPPRDRRPWEIQYNSRLCFRTAIPVNVQQTVGLYLPIAEYLILKT